MNHVVSFLKDIRFLIPAGFLIAFELFLQSGLYRHLLKPNTYAENVNRITDVVRESPVSSEANVLILGTSVAYQGINLTLLNELLSDTGLRVQSGATEGAMLITQHSLYRSLSPSLPRLKAVVHVAEITSPWTARYFLDPPNRSMAAQFPAFRTLSLMKEYQYKTGFSDYTYFLIKSSAYQQDLRDFALNPPERIKRLGRKFAEDKKLYPYENQYSFAISSYGNPADLQDCIAKGSAGIPYVDASGREVTDIHHQRAVVQTCQLGMHDPWTHPGRDQWADLYFTNLKSFYSEIQRSGQRVMVVFPPYSELLRDSLGAERMQVWENGLKHTKQIITADLRTSLDGPGNLDYYYDTIHLNREGSLLFTRKLAEELRKAAPEILNTQPSGNGQK